MGFELQLDRQFHGNDGGDGYVRCLRMEDIKFEKIGVQLKIEFICLSTRHSPVSSFILLVSRYNLLISVGKPD